MLHQSCFFGFFLQSYGKISSQLLSGIACLRVILLLLKLTLATIFPMMRNDLPLKKYLLLPLVFFLVPLMSFATHQRAAEITYRHVSGLTYEITLITYTRTGMPANAYRNVLPINWGDGTSGNIPRIEIIDLPGDPTYGITYNKYIGTHTYTGPSTYVISLEDPNRNQDIRNIPNSVNIPLYIYSELVINPFLGYNSSPLLLIPPIDNGCVGEPFYHNPGAYDPDGDSLSYRLVTCLGANGLPIPGYYLPSATNSLTLNPITGDLVWDSPDNTQQGMWNFAILIEEWRKGVKIGSVERDMQVIIVPCNTPPPYIDAVADTCVQAGDTLNLTVTAHQPNGDSLALLTTGGPLVMSNHPATMDTNPVYGRDVVSSHFTWPTVCQHVQLQSYRLFFKANNFATPVNQVAISSMQIRVVGPAPENLTATALGTSITLHWDTYACQNAKGFYIYRKSDSTGFHHGYCQTGVPPGLGYVKIGQIDDITATTFVDNNNGNGLGLGFKYCYMIVAYFPDLAESYASLEACTSLKKDIPVITNVSVNVTGEANGSIYIAWSKPTEIDTVQEPGPYKYVIYRSVPGSTDQYTAIDSLNDLNDTILTDNLLNTKQYAYRYKIAFYNNTPGNYFLIGYSQTASSIFLNIAPTDKRLVLSWNNNVPWTNYLYTIYRKNPMTSSFDSVGTSDHPSYTDRNLINGTEYCYRVKSTGEYSAPGFVDPILNFSQETCAIPVDNVPPCKQALSDSTICPGTQNQAISDTLSWKNPSDTCSNDIRQFYIFHAPGPGGPFTLLDSLPSSVTTYVLSPGGAFIGCYYIVAVDSVGNRSLASDTICIDIDVCPDARYHLPNVFTPNGDVHNDFFTPFPGYYSVEKVDMTIFDRWGKKVFTTNDPEINWDGKDNDTKQPCSDGAYFYNCNVYETTLQGTGKRVLKGYVTLLR
jgi:gliding motility-associated-like protein